MSPIASAFAALRSGQGLKGQLMRGGVGSVAIKIGSTLLNVVLAIVLARVLGAEGFGVYSFVFALITIIAIPAQMGLPNLVVRETAKAQAAGDWALMKGLWRWSSLMALAMSVALMVIGGLAAWIFAANLPEGGLAVFYWGLVLVPLVALSRVAGAAVRGLRKVVIGQLPDGVLRPALLILLLLMAALFGAELEPRAAMVLHASAAVMALLFAAVAWHLASPMQIKKAVLPPDIRRNWLSASIILALFEGMQIFNDTIGIVILGYYGYIEESGYLRIAYQAASLVTFGMLAINLAISPYIAENYVKGNKDKLARMAALSTIGSISFAIPVLTGILFFYEPLIEFAFGAEFSPASTYLLVLCVGQAFNAFTGCTGVMLYMTGREKDVAVAMLSAAIANVGLVVWLLPFYGPISTAVAASAALILWNTMLFIAVYRHLGITTFPYIQRARS